MRALLLSILAALTLACLLQAQSSAPFVVTAATPGPAGPATALSDPQSFGDLLKKLKEMKAANEETLRKQAAALEQLDELEKVADQIRLYTRRS
jgi:hypothetical protein